MKLFTKEINDKLYKQYPKGGDLENQVVVAKIFNPYGNGRWFLLNSDPQDPDYLWAIVEMGKGNVEIGSVSRRELESIRVTAWRFPLERDLSFRPINAKMVYDGLLQGKHFDEGGEVENENKEMLENQATEIKHHSEELKDALKDTKEVEPWVVAKAERSATDLSDITHYLEGESKSEYAKGGRLDVGRYYRTTDGRQVRYLGDSSDPELGTFMNKNQEVFKVRYDEITGKASLFEYGGVINRDLNIKVRDLAIKNGITPQALGRDYMHIMAQAVVVSLGDANFHSEAKALVSKLEKEPWNDDLYNSIYYNAPDEIDDFARKVASMSGWDGVDIANAYTYILKMNGEHTLAKMIEQVMNEEYASGGMMAHAGKTPNKQEWTAVYVNQQKPNERKVIVAYGNSKKEAISDARMSEGYHNIKYPYELQDIYTSSGNFPMEADSMASGGMVDPMSTVNEIARLSGLRPVAVAEWGDKNNINLAIVLKDLKSKKIKGMDLMTAIVGNPNNKYQNELLSKYSRTKMASGGMMAKGGETESEEVVYIEYLNKAKKFAKDKKEFKGEDAYKEAISWGRKNIPNFNADMVKFKMASGGMMADGGELKDSAKMKADNPNWTNEDLLKEYNKNKSDLIEFNEGRLKPSKVIGGGYKSSAIAKKLAKKWLEDRVEEYKMALEMRGVLTSGGMMAQGGRVKFADKVEAVKKSLLERKKVPKAVQKDYGKTFSSAEAEDSAKRIVGAQTARERLKARIKSKKK